MCSLANRNILAQIYIHNKGSSGSSSQTRVRVAFLTCQDELNLEVAYVCLYMMCGELADRGFQVRRGAKSSKILSAPP